MDRVEAAAAVSFDPVLRALAHLGAPVAHAHTVGMLPVWPVGPPLEITLKRASEDVRWGLGLGPNQEVSEVHVGSVAEAAGVKKGAIIIKVNNESIIPNPQAGLTGEAAMGRLEAGLGGLQVKLTLVLPVRMQAAAALSPPPPPCSHAGTIAPPFLSLPPSLFILPSLPLPLLPPLRFLLPL